ncbi:MAG: hypothetical protein V1726_01920 [Methanobacteriota archaeon]
MRKRMYCRVGVLFGVLLLCAPLVQGVVSASDPENDSLIGRAPALTFFCGVIRKAHSDESGVLVFSPVAGFDWTVWDAESRLPSIPVLWVIRKVVGDSEIRLDPGQFSGVFSGFFIVGFYRHSVPTR